MQKKKCDLCPSRAAFYNETVFNSGGAALAALFEMQSKKLLVFAFLNANNEVGNRCKCKCENALKNRIL